MNEPKTLNVDEIAVPPPLESDTRKYDDVVGNTEAANNIQVQPVAPPRILYHAKCVEPGNQVKVFYSEQPFVGLNLHGFDDEKPTPLIEVEFTVNGKVNSKRETDKYTPYSSTTRAASARFGSDGDFIPDSIAEPTLHIHSKDIRDELRKIVEYYPSQNMNGETVQVLYPYRMLMHYLSELNAAKERYEKESQAVIDVQTELTDQRIQSDSKAKADALQVLLEYIFPIYKREVEPGAQRQAMSVPLTTYSMLWFLFMPGKDVYAKIGRKWRAFVVMSVQEQKNSKETAPPGFNFYLGLTEPKRDKWLIKVWSLAFDGKRLFRRKRELSIEEFYGEREVTSLNIVPCEIYDRLNGNARRKELEIRGSEYYKLLKNIPGHLSYDGIAVAKFEKTQPWDQPLKRVFEYTGDIVVDPSSYRKHGPTKERSNYYGRRKTTRILEDDGETDEEEDTEYYQDYEPENFGGGPRWEGYNNIQPSTEEALTEHQQFLLPADIRGFALKTKLWMAFDVKQIKPMYFPPHGEGAIENLILHPNDVQYLKALSTKTSRPSTAQVDFIKGKGEGQIFLFHGPPGTGKTYTVEAVAQYTYRPLLSLTVADLGLQEGTLEAQMSKWFQLATRWGAVLLIDEADVFLEKRKSSNVGRNSLVSLFLRTMEYYSGLLFLTTNRPGAIDDAFRSRIHSAINFPSFNSDRSNHLWTVFLDKIKKEDPTIKITAGARKFLRTDINIKKMDWSGREIRNAFSLALTLARYDYETNTEKDDDDNKIEVTREHFEDVILRRDEFIKYIDSIRDMKEDMRAYEVGDRRDATLEDSN